MKQLLSSMLLVLTGLAVAHAADRPQWGERYSRNQISHETGLPDTFDPTTGHNVRWSVPLGTQCYSTPVVAAGRMFLGINNDVPRDPRHQGDRGVLVCLDEKDGSLCWQLVVPKLTGDIYKDWPHAGLCSPATVESNRVYIVSNRGEVMCLDINGLADGNDGAYQDEARHMTPADAQTIPLGATDADIIWVHDMVNESGVYPHDSAHSSILLRGPHLYLNTGNGVDNTHKTIRKPDAPSLIVLDKSTGRLIGRDDEHIGPRIFHSTWSSPALGIVNGHERVFFCGGNGVCYAFAPCASRPQEEMGYLEKTWWFDCDPGAPKENVSQYMRNRNEGPTTVMGMPVYHEGRIYLTAGGDIWWGKREAWLHCIDATGTGDISTTGKVWSYRLNRHCCTTPAIHDGLAYVVDWGHTLHCVDIKTGKAVWTHDTEGRAYASALVADGKVYVSTMTSRVWVLSAGREKGVLSCVKLDSPISSTPVAANGVLYIATFKHLYAVGLSTTP